MAFFSDELQKLMKEFQETKKALQEARDELRDKIAELENTNTRLEVSERELKSRVVELDRNQQAMLNVLEDARELESNLIKERDLTKAVISSMGEGLLVVDKEHKIILMNQAATILLRRAAGDSLGKNIHEVFTICKGGGKEEEACLLPVEQLTKEPNIININLEDNFYCHDKDGNKFPVTVIMASLLQTSLQGEITGAVIVFRNVTTEKNLDEAKTSFISIASHQLRTPLTSMRWFSEMLLDGDAGDLKEDQKHFVDRIYQGVDRMINLVNLLLQIARVEMGRVKIEPVPLDLKLVTEGVVMTLQTQLKEKKQKIEVKSSLESIPKIPMDEDVAWQIIQNLLTNAIRYSPEKGLITIALNVDQGKQELVYSVKDRGIGIPKDQQNRIFEKFYRADNAVKHVPEGSGLGLNLVKKLVSDWQGRIWFESEEGKGTTFFFTVPLKGVRAREGEVKLKV